MGTGTFGNRAGLQLISVQRAGPRYKHDGASGLLYICICACIYIYIQIDSYISIHICILRK